MTGCLSGQGCDSAKAGIDESGPASASRLPTDATLAGATDEVRRARARSLEKSAATFAPEAGVAAEAPAPEAPVKKTPAKRAAKAKAPEGGR